MFAWLDRNAPVEELLWREPDRFRAATATTPVADRLLLVEAALDLVCASPSPRRLKGVLLTSRNLGFSRARVDRLTLGRFGIDLYGLEACSILGVQPDASEPTIKRAYRRLASRVHPDRVASLGEQEQDAARRRMVVLNAALDRLMKPDVELEPDGPWPYDPDDVELEPIRQMEVDDVLLEFAHLDDDIEL
ncbi:MAG: hypothetical protein ACI8PZ_006116 [Myxococcota bacterium]|jgi:hypothetical protein